MEDHTGVGSFKFGDKYTSDITIRLKNNEGRQELLHLHSSILISKSTYFADRLLDPSPNACLEIECTDVNYDHHLKLLKCLYLPKSSLSDAWDCVHSALNVLQVAITLRCDSIVHSCLQYLEAVPWEDNDEDEIVLVVSQLNPSIAMPVLARIQPANSATTKNIFVSAIRFATKVDGPFPPFGDELRVSAQEQVEYMLSYDDGDMALVAADNDVKLETRTGLAKTFSLFERELSLHLETSGVRMVAEDDRIMCCLSDLEWLCGVLLKMGLMDDFVSMWIDVSESMLRAVEDDVLLCVMWGFKVKLIQLTSKVLDVVGYGNVILVAPLRVRLIKSWLPFIRKLKPLLDSTAYKIDMDEDLWQGVEGAIVSVVSALPSDDQADILTDWMDGGDQLGYPDLSEAFEVWCFRTKSSKRRLVGGLDIVNTTVSL